MPITIGALVTDHIAVARIDKGRISGPLRRFPEPGSATGVPGTAPDSSRMSEPSRAGESSHPVPSLEAHDPLEAMHADQITEQIGEEILAVAGGEPIRAVGLGFPGINRAGLIEESPNLTHTKGLNLGPDLAKLLATRGSEAFVHVMNDADALAAGIFFTIPRSQTGRLPGAATTQLTKLIRVWFLGRGIGLGHYPEPNDFGEGGHMTVTLDPKENLCGCGGVGHLEGIMGERAMRRRFLDLEPDEVFVAAASGDERCAAFVTMWHRALAAATAAAIHLDGPGRFFISGPNARHVQIPLVDRLLHTMVKMSTLQGSKFEIVAGGDEIALIGAAQRAVQAHQLT